MLTTVERLKVYEKVAEVGGEELVGISIVEGLKTAQNPEEVFSVLIQAITFLFERDKIILKQKD